MPFSAIYALVMKRVECIVRKILFPIIPHVLCNPKCSEVDVATIGFCICTLCGMVYIVALPFMPLNDIVNKANM